MRLSLTEEHQERCRAYLNAGVRVFHRGSELKLSDFESAQTEKSSRPAPATPGPRDFASALAVELKAGLPVTDAIRGAASKYPALYRQYCNELTDPAPAEPGPDAMPAGRSYGVDPAGAELARHMAAGGKLEPGAPGYRQWIESFREPK